MTFPEVLFGDGAKKRWFFAYVVVASLDFYITFIMISLTAGGVPEGNPIVRFLIERWGLARGLLFTYFFILFFAVVTYLVWDIAKGTWQTFMFHGFVWLMVLVRFIAVEMNIMFFMMSMLTGF